MKKKFLAIVLTVALAVLGTVSMLAVDEPVVTNDAVVYVSYNSGNNDYSGKSADEAKKQLLTLEDNAACSMLRDGGTMIASGKIYIGGAYAFPEFGSTVKITANDGTTDYKNEMPLENPASGVLKMASGVTLTLNSDMIFDDIILFQEGAMNTISVANNSTLVIGADVVSKSNINSLEPCYMAIAVEAGSTAILNGGIFQKVSGEGTIINNGATIIEDGSQDGPASSDAPVTSDAAPVTSADTSADVSTEADTSAPDTSDSEDPKQTEKTTAATTPESSKPETKPDTGTTPPATEPAPSEDFGNTGLIVAIVAAAIIIVVVAAVVIVKKKKK